MGNPFTLGFGTTPELLIGRDDVLDEVAQAFGVGYDPHRTTWLRAPRGTGKTVLLNELQTLAGQAGWLVVQEDAQTPGDLVERTARRLRRVADGTAEPPRRLRSAAVHTPLGGGSIELTDPTPAQAELRDTIIALLQADVAGLRTDNDDDLATFLGRCSKPQLGALPTNAVRLGLQQTARIGDRGFSADALDLATKVTAGYAYMLQLVGYWAWRQSDGPTVTLSDVRAALPRCQHELLDAVPGLKQVHISPAMNDYLLAMAIDDETSNTGTIASRLDITPQHAGVYRERLIDAGVIVAVGRGLVDLALPGHRAALRIGRIIDDVDRFQ